jgi:hypothetical protein
MDGCAPSAELLWGRQCRPVAIAGQMSIIYLVVLYQSRTPRFTDEPCRCVNKKPPLTAAVCIKTTLLIGPKLTPSVVSAGLGEYGCPPACGLFTF